MEFQDILVVPRIPTGYLLTGVILVIFFVSASLLVCPPFFWLYFYFFWLFFYFFWLFFYFLRSDGSPGSRWSRRRFRRIGRYIFFFAVAWLQGRDVSMSIHHFFGPKKFKKIQKKSKKFARENNQKKKCFFHLFLGILISW